MFELINKNGVFLLKSTVLKSKHAFSTRIGGVSSMEHTKSLNLAYGRGDDEAVVRRNVEIFADALQIDAQKIISVPQIHSDFVIIVDETNAGEGIFKETTLECDGYITNKVGLPVAVKTADCVPILLEARDDCGKVLAVAAIHAGWRGTADKIAARAIEKFSLLGAEPRNIYAVIGPSIDECCYEVGNDFANAIREKLGQNYEIKYIKRKTNEALYADLKGMNLEILMSCGVPMENIDVCEYCTCCNPELFYSHRGQKGKRGTMMNLICK